MPEEDLLDYFFQFVSEHKQKLFLNNINYRTRHLTVVVENIFQSHNASAVLRSCDCFGVQDVHIIENSNTYELNPDVALGASKWLNLHKYNSKANNTEDCLKTIKNKGYRLIATTPHETDFNLSEIDVTQKTALVFGTEGEGLSETALNMADACVKIPIYGFTESFNISVSAALCLYEFTEKMRKSNVSWQLSDEEKKEILLDWSRQVIKKHELLEKRFFNKGS